MISRKFKTAVFYIQLFWISSNCLEDYVVQIKNGQVRRPPIITINNNTIFGFKEIRYASPPVGNLRFKLEEYIVQIKIGKTGRAPIITTNNNTNYGFKEIPFASPPVGNLSFKLEDYVVQIKNGKIRGVPIITINNNTIYGFKEIPYASPPVGNLRFKDPVPAQNWDGILNTTDVTKICWEFRDDSVYDPRQNEDCLYLNVFTPTFPGPLKRSLPVWVYIYGGRFAFGFSTKVDPQLLVETGIVAVIMNFRSGPLGFLTTEDGVIPANLGLKDQHLALKWVQENIAFFGGDPSKVVLAGHSSGSYCVSHHLFSSRSAGLFRGAILQSGSAVSSVGTARKARKMAFEMGRQLSPNFSERNSSEELLKLLLQTPAERISNAKVFIKYLEPDKNILEQVWLVRFWGPVIERADIPNAYLTELPFNNLLTGKFQKVPLLVSMTSEEGLDTWDMQQKVASGVENSSIFFENNNIKPGFEEHVQKRVIEIYTNSSFDEDRPALLRYFSDYSFSMGLISQANHHARFADTYFCQFSYVGKMNELVKNFKKVNFKGIGKVGHTQDVPYTLFYPGKPENFHNFPEADLFMQRRMVRLWSNFVKYLNPTPVKEPLLEFKKWPKISPRRRRFAYIDIDTNVTIVQGFPRSYEKWVPLINDFYKHPLETL